MMTEERAKEVIQHGDSSIEVCKEADLFVKQYALKELNERLMSCDNKVIKDYVILMTKSTFGSTETDKFLMDLHCYPEWITGFKDHE